MCGNEYGCVCYSVAVFQVSPQLVCRCLTLSLSIVSFLAPPPAPSVCIEGEAERDKHAHGATLHGRSALTNSNTIPDPGVWQRVRFVCGAFTCLTACTPMCVCAEMEASRAAGLCEQVFTLCVFVCVSPRVSCTRLTKCLGAWHAHA
jgi:hypothetical protein